ncbi:MAG: DUF1257 domain-containing protein [Bacteroidia bacterium]|nr:DUF1257 domain-containing protein [Bacteroidia bacterium]MDW8135004.1 DUF1257 domain-containing protein [Bacteroidia bacterium]
MSHFTRIQTQFVEKEYLRKALEDLGYKVRESGVVRGWRGQRTEAELVVESPTPGYDIGFRKSGETYEVVADWWGIRSLKQETLLAQLRQRYAYHATLDKLQKQGFSLAAEEKQADGRIRLVLRRMR